MRWAALATALFGLGLAVQLTGGPAWTYWALYLACYAAGGWEPGQAGLLALRERRLDVDLLMVVAALGAASIGQVLDGGLLIVIFATSGALEAVATRRTEESVRGLLDHAPETATVLTPDGERTVEAQALAVGDFVLVRPGERIAGDGVVTEGCSDVEQATITGEPLPVTRQPGDEVFAGTLNGRGALRVRVTSPATETVLARIVAMVAEASATKSRTQLFVERIEQRYSVGMVAATVALFVVPLLLGAELESALLRAMTFMIVASPCAIVLATMPPLLSAIATAGRHGVLVKSAVVLERLASVDRVAFDKTGTLTEGTPQLTSVHVLPGAPLAEDELLSVAAAAEAPSEHPLGRAVVAAAKQPIGTATDFTSAPGHGISARVGGQLIEIGRPGATAPLVAARETDDRTVVVVRVDGTPAGVLGFADRLRPGAVHAVAAVRALTGSTPILLTGDGPAVARRLAAEAGIDDVRAGLLPEDKVTAVRELEAAGHRVLLVGDGVNDAPALASAHVGVAMGRTGSDLALDTADAVITRDELTTVPAAITLARRAHRVVVANLVIAATFIAVLVAWDLFGTLPLPLGVAGHEGSTVLVGLNGLRLLRSAAWPRATVQS
ncbi:heavy metal translocating P-type ATPase [Cryptosporangium japonicum]|uniref:heavy metal translocating P-type ATPase n=1 Tax=Cryptosporangium japonicum TaxID=80872 RepID=UPI0031DCFD75